MKVLYFDIIAGISGDMTVAALLNLGVSPEKLKAELKKIKLSGYTLKTSMVERGHAKALKFDCLISKNRNFSYNEISRLINRSRFSVKVKANFLKVYSSLYKAETKVHGHKHSDMRFHEIGDIDSIVDIASACICLDKLEAESILYSTIPLSHNLAPATFELLNGKDVYFTGNTFENVTPTGIAILDALGKQIAGSECPGFKIGRCGYGAGTHDPLKISNTLRVAELKTNDLDTDEVRVIEANIDDMNPQCFEYVFDKLFEAGALDCFVTPIYMKKTRPGFLLTVLSKAENFGNITEIMLSETSSSGLRFDLRRRLKLDRVIRQLEFKGNKIRVKVIGRYPDMRFAPEYEDCKKAAVKLKMPLINIFEQIKRKAEVIWHSQG